MRTHKIVPFFVLPLVLTAAAALIVPVAAHENAHEQTNGKEEMQPAAKPPPSARDEQSTQQYFTDLPLLTQDGRQVRFYSDVLKDNVVLINTIYTNCRDACPLITNKLTHVRDQLGERFGKTVYFVSISTDPLRDTPEALAKFARQQKADGAGWVFLTGEKQNIETILQKLGQYSPEVEAHSTVLLAGNVKARRWLKIRPDTPIAGIVLQLQDLADGS